MPEYANLNGSSAVTHYEIEEDAIIVTYRGGAAYRYTYASAGAAHIEHMKTLAQAGHGLATFISQVVKKQYESKL